MYVSYAETSVKKIEDTFKDFTNRDDIAIILINQHIANMIRHLIDGYIQVQFHRHSASLLSSEDSCRTTDLCSLTSSRCKNIALLHSYMRCRWVRAAHPSNPGDPQQGAPIRPQQGLHLDASEDYVWWR